MLILLSDWSKTVGGWETVLFSLGEWKTGLYQFWADGRDGDNFKAAKACTLYKNSCHDQCTFGPICHIWWPREEYIFMFDTDYKF